MLHHLLLVVAVLALAHASLRAAAAWGAAGLQLPIAATVLASTAAGVTSLAWGLTGLSGNAWILTLSALAAAVAAGCAVGGTWCLRDWVDHGSPLWPFVGGDVPEFLARFGESFLGNPAGTLRGRTDIYVDLLAGGLILLAAGLLAPLADRRGPVLVTAGAALLAALAWVNAPFTGLAEDHVLFELSLTTTRYLLPAIAAAAAAIAFARHRAVDAVLALTVIAEGLGRRQGGIGRLDSAGVISRLLAQPAIAEGDDPVAFAPQIHAVLAGDPLEHEIEMIPPREPGPRTLARRGWIVVGTLPLTETRTPFNAVRCLSGERPVSADPRFRVSR